MQFVCFILNFVDDILLQFDFVVIDVEMVCLCVSSICQVGIVGFCDGVECFVYEMLVDFCDEFNVFNICIYGIVVYYVVGQLSFVDIYVVIDGYLLGCIMVVYFFFDKGVLVVVCWVYDCVMIEICWLDSVCVVQCVWFDFVSYCFNVFMCYFGIDYCYYDVLSDVCVVGWVIVKVIEYSGLLLVDWLVLLCLLGFVLCVVLEGLLLGEWIVILGELCDGLLVYWIVVMGVWVMILVGFGMMMLLVVLFELFGCVVWLSVVFQKV